MERALLNKKKEPILVMAIGMPGSGKTTLLKPFAKRNGFTYISTDEIRSQLFGDPLAQTNNNLVYEKATRRANDALKEGKSAVYDSTLAEKQRRVERIAIMRKMGWKKIIGFYVNTPFDIAKERNKNREHVVPESELDTFYTEPLTQNPPSVKDGFDEIYTLENIEEFHRKFWG